MDYDEFSARSLKKICFLVFKRSTLPCVYKVEDKSNLGIQLTLWYKYLVCKKCDRFI